MATPRVAGGRFVTSRPPISTRPSLAVSSPAMMRRQVVLPQPEGPSNTVKLPACTSRETVSRAVTPPQRRLTRVNRTAAPPGEATVVEPARVIVGHDTEARCDLYTLPGRWAKLALIPKRTIGHKLVI